MEARFVQLAGVYGFLAVALGAFGAHGLRARFAALPDAASRFDWWHTATLYQAIHALAIGLAAYLVFRSPGVAARVAGIAFAVRIPLFSGSLYVMALTGLRPLGAVTPLGGLAFLVGWVAVIVAGSSLD